MLTIDSCATPTCIEAAGAPRRELRLAHANDVAAVAGLLRHGDVWRWCVGGRAPESALAALLGEQVRRNERDAACLWVLAAGSRCLGFVSLEDGEIAFAVDGATLGRGLGSELVRRFCELARRDLRVARLKACVQRANVRAIRCLERQGFRFAGVTRRASDSRLRLQPLLAFESQLDRECVPC